MERRHIANATVIGQMKVGSWWFGAAYPKTCSSAVQEKVVQKAVGHRQSFREFEWDGTARLETYCESWPALVQMNVGQCLSHCYRHRFIVHKLNSRNARHTIPLA